jgi:hypothetical protein
VRRVARWVAAAALLAAALTAAVPVAAAAQSAPGRPTLVIETSPEVPGATFALGGQSVRAGPDGTARMAPASWVDLRAKMRVTAPPVKARLRARFARWYGLPKFSHTPKRDYVVTAAFDIDYRISLSFVDLEDHPVDYGKISNVEVKDATGVIHRFTGEQLRRPVWLWGTRVVSLQSGALPKSIYYTVQSVTVAGANVVNQAQQRYEPVKDAALKVRLLFYSATFEARDAVFGFPVGSAVRLRYPDGQRGRFPLDARHEVVVGSLPRGEYDATIEGPGLPVSAPVSITRPQRLTLKLVTWLDLAVVMAAAAAFLGGLPLLRRRRLRWRAASEDDLEDNADNLRDDHDDAVADDGRVEERA